MIVFERFPIELPPFVIVALQTYFEDYFGLAPFWFRFAGELYKEELLEVLHE